MTAVRAFRRSDDLEAFLSLYERVFGRARDRAWFDWKYASGPGMSAPRIVVAVSDGTDDGAAGELVGARPFLPMRLAVGERRVLAVQPVDAMVHPEFRRQGVFTAMTKWALAAFEASDASLCFNFPNEAAAAGNRRLGWRKVQERASFYRFLDPSRVAESADLRPLAKAAASAVAPAVSGYNAMRRAMTSTDEAVTVRRERAVPVEELASRYRARPPDAIHVVRDAAFWEHWTANPDWRYETYLADDDESALLVGRSTRPDRDVARVTDVLPPGESRSRAALAALLSRALDDHDDAAMVVAPPLADAADLLADLGFLCDRDPPLQYVATPTNHYVRTLTGEWTVAGVDIADAANWTLTSVERDTT
ncbi:GNAT family N-acetyltransferase [Halorubellus sp. PRR65]|uniref:GNAT family N-acetyltransferase n=1 Tax=Halorubellus sp. PRR65 TaxID=3098148 RepID=UPI002B258BF7|nr:GNAT family N-acetyltransferase [Halorubellus sp. PRR65]